MKMRIMILTMILVTIGTLSAQIAEDDIYFNPKTDKQLELRIKEQRRQLYQSQYEENFVEVVPEVDETLPLTDEDNTYTERIYRFHNSTDFGVHIADPNYVDIYYVGGGYYNVYIDPSFINFTPWYSPFYYSSFWNSPFYYNSWSNPWYYSFNPWQTSWYNPWNNSYVWDPWFYNPLYSPGPCYGCDVPYYSTYTASENDRRNSNSDGRFSGTVTRSSTTEPASRSSEQRYEVEPSQQRTTTPSRSGTRYDGSITSGTRTSSTVRQSSTTTTRVQSNTTSTRTSSNSNVGTCSEGSRSNLSNGTVSSGGSRSGGSSSGSETRRDGSGSGTRR